MNEPARSVRALMCGTVGVEIDGHAPNHRRT